MPGGAPVRVSEVPGRGGWSGLLGQVGAGRARIVANASAIWPAHGQLAGSRSRRRRPPRARRAGTCSIRNRSSLGFGLGEVAVQGEQLEPGDQVGGDRGDLDPHLVDVELPGREPAEAGVLGDPDAVLDPGVGPVPGLQERQLAGARCWWRRLGSASRRPVRTRSARRRDEASPGAR